mmetsp:Transcript_72645/g.128355  ORF Transcript_72645/g.128355 Transcript_72645/m.128355 type:complete len:224 (+) Transcript_72645:197-868(+)
MVQEAGSDSSPDLSRLECELSCQPWCQHQPAAVFFPVGRAHLANSRLRHRRSFLVLEAMAKSPALLAPLLAPKVLAEHRTMQAWEWKPSQPSCEHPQRQSCCKHRLEMLLALGSTCRAPCRAAAQLSNPLVTGPWPEKTLLAKPLLLHTVCWDTLEIAVQLVTPVPKTRSPQWKFRRPPVQGTKCSERDARAVPDFELTPCADAAACSHSQSASSQDPLRILI